MKKQVIQFKDYTFKYRTQIDPTLYNINLTIYEGEKVLIVGPSGSGKSTLAHCINGLVPNSYEGEVKGSLTICGEDPSKAGIFGMSKVAGTVLQDPDSQFIGLTVAEDIAFALENDCVKQDKMKEIVKECAELVGVEKLLKQSPQDLSGGQKQRVAIAGVMTDKVEVLLFDEPLASLDPATGKYAIELIDKIHRETNTTIVIIEHRLEDVLHCKVDRIIVVDEGKIVSDTTPNKLLESDILKKIGIREPLYVTAMKYAACKIKAEDMPENIKNMKIEPYVNKVKQWFSSIEKTGKAQLNEPILTIQNLSFAYNESKKVLENINFNINKGEMLSIVGTNGAGKSTLSKLICGFMAPTEGKILFAGKDMKNDSIKKRAEKIGIVMQNPNQMISKPMIYDEVALGLRVRGIAEEKIKQRVEDTLKICGLYPFRNWPIAALSFGQKKRVTIAAILVLNPQVLILDEPTAGQDFRHYTEIMTFLEKINKDQGITIIMITHDMHLMLEYTNRAIVISNGRLVADESSAKVLTSKDIIKKASLKTTSLFDLANLCGIKDTTSFVEKFIDYDREVSRS